MREGGRDEMGRAEKRADKKKRRDQRMWAQLSIGRRERGKVGRRERRGNEPESSGERVELSNKKASR